MSKKKTVIPLDGWSAKEKAISAINRLNLADSWQVTIEPYVEKRSLNQSALYFMWCDKAAKFFSTKGQKYVKDDLHTIFRHLHLGYQNVKVGQTEIKDQLRSTADLDKDEMYSFMMRVDEWCLSHGLTLPTPEGSEFEKMKEANK